MRVLSDLGIWSDLRKNSRFSKMLVLNMFWSDLRIGSDLRILAI